MFCYFLRPREKLIDDIIDTMTPYFIDDNISLLSYLKQIAVVCETDIDTICIISKNDQIIVLINPEINEDDMIRLIARVRLNHVYAQNCDVSILEEEISLFVNRFHEKCYCNNLALHK